MPATSTLIDNFNDNSRNTDLWTQFGGASETGGALSLPGSAGGQYSGYSSLATNYDLTGSYIRCQVIDAGTQSFTTWELYAAQIFMDTGNANSLYIIINQGSVQAYVKVAGSQSTVGSPFTYDSSVHKWFGIRESGGTIFYIWSTDGVHYTDFASTAVPFVITAMQIEPVAGNFGAEAGVSTAIIDNFNVLPTVASWLSA